MDGDWDYDDRLSGWNGEAWGMACMAYWRLMRHRRGVFSLRPVNYGPVVVRHGLCVFDNEPDTRQPRLTEFRQWLRATGLREIAEASCPRWGPDDGMTFVLLIDAEGRTVEEVAAAWQGTIVRPELETSHALPEWVKRRTVGPLDEEG